MKDIQMRKGNTPAHIDIGVEMQKMKGKWFHFEIRCSGGNIVDFVTREYESFETFNNKTTSVSRNR